jgi:uncharacterized Zn-finger protein
MAHLSYINSFIHSFIHSFVRITPYKLSTILPNIAEYILQYLLSMKKSVIDIGIFIYWRGKNNLISYSHKFLYFKKWSENIPHNFSYKTNLDYFTLKKQSIVVQQTIVLWLYKTGHTSVSLVFTLTSYASSIVKLTSHKIICDFKILYNNHPHLFVSVTCTDGRNLNNCGQEFFDKISIRNLGP